MVCVACALCFVLGGTSAGPSRPDERARVLASIAAIERLGGTVERDPTRPGRPVVKVSLWTTMCTDADLIHLLAFPELRVLACHGSCKEHHKNKITDAGLKHIGRLTKLEEIDLSWQPGITDGGLAELKRLPNLRKIDLYMTAVTATGHAALDR
jgi:hypothetical protein